MSKQTEMVRFNLEMSPKVADKLEQMSKSEHTSKKDILLKALFLLDIAIKSKEKGNEVAVIDKSGHKISDIIL